MALTDSWLRSINGKPQEKVITKSDRDGLSVRVTPKGKVIFQYRYRWNGKAERLDIGTYPATSLKEARDLTLSYKGSLEQNKNPKVVKLTQKQTAITAYTVESLVTEWYEKSLKQDQVKADKIFRSFQLHVFPSIGKLPHDDVDLHTWLPLLEEITERTPSIGHQILKYAKKSHFWGFRRGVITNRPLSDLNPSDLGIKIEQGERVLTNEELSLLFQFIDQDRYNPRNEIIIKLCLLFGNRVGELLKAKITDFDLKEGIWTIPPENHKRGRLSGQPLIRAITPAAQQLIQRAISVSRGDYLFTLMNGQPMREGGHLGMIDVLSKRMSKKVESCKPWSIHDLRRTMRTGVSNLTAPHIAEIMIGHKLPGAWQVYDKYTYLDEQREAYEKWWDKVLKIVYHSPNQ